MAMLDKFRQQEKKEYLMRVDTIVSEALRNKCWIYQPANKLWWTPEEFKKEFEGNVINDPNWFNKFKLMYPIFAIKAADKQIAQIQAKKAVFEQKVFEYYLNKTK
jgi:hypothetical protein